MCASYWHLLNPWSPIIVDPVTLVLVFSSFWLGKWCPFVSVWVISYQLACVPRFSISTFLPPPPILGGQTFSCTCFVFGDSLWEIMSFATCLMQLKNVLQNYLKFKFSFEWLCFSNYNWDLLWICKFWISSLIIKKS